MTDVIALTLYVGIVGHASVGESISSAHGASPNGDETELESVRALRKMNTEEHDIRKTRTYGALT